MSMIHRVLTVLVAVSALAFNNVSHAETPDAKEGRTVVGSVAKHASDRLQLLVDTITHPMIDVKELNCLARNIFYEAANEPEEGKVAVGLVTLNRASNERFPQTVCGVVKQRTTFSVPKTQTKEVKTGWKTKTVTETVWEKLTICQFSWQCMPVKNPKQEDERWLESQRIALDLLADTGNYFDYRVKYAEALYFHATFVKPTWARQKNKVERIGGHIFYADRRN